MKENKGKITRTISEGDGSCYGYHVSHISKGVLGYLSKIQEELDEAKDFESQNNPVGVLLELSDLLGAVDAYLKNRHPSISLWDLVTMFEATHRAFTCGERSKEEEEKDFKWDTQGFKYPGVTLEDTFTDVQAVTISSDGSGEQSWTSGQNQDEQSNKVVKKTLADLISAESVKQAVQNTGKRSCSIQEDLWVCGLCGKVENTCLCLTKGK